MTTQEILERITANRANELRTGSGQAFDSDVARKIPEIEWALQALAEKLADLSMLMRSKP